MIYPDAIVNEDKKTIKKRFTSIKTSKALLFAPKIKMEERYCAKTMIGIL